MTTAATLVLIADASGLKKGENALDSLARTGGRVEGKLTVDMKSIEKAMASLGGVMGNLDNTMKAVERAVTGSMGRAQQETTKAARTFDDLRRSIDPAYAAAERFKDVQAELGAMVSDGRAKQEAANQVLEIARSRYLGIATAAEQAEQAQRQQAAAVASATSNYQALRAAVDPVYAASKRYEAAQETLTAAVREGVISQTEMNRVLAMTERQFLAPATGLKGMAVAADTAKDGLARFTPQITNASFQVQDFAVQVASGQSAIMAFTQQFPQLAGALGFSGALALVGAGLGTLVAVGAAVAPVIVKMTSATRDYEDALEGLKNAQDAINQSLNLATMPASELIEIYGAGASRVRELATAQLQLNVAVARGELAKSVTSLRDVTHEYTKLGVGFSTYAKALANIERDFGLTGDAAVELRTRLRDLNNAANAEVQLSQFKDLARFLNEAGVPLEKMPPAFAQAAANLLNLNINAEELQALIARGNVETNGAVGATFDWAVAMAGVRAEILGIASALSQIGGGMISNAAKYVEINALKAGRSVAEARIEMEKFNVAAKYDGQIMAAEARGGVLGWTEAQALKAAKAMELSGIAAATEADALRRSAAEAERAAASKGRAGGASSAAAKESAKLADNLNREAERWRDLLDPMSKYRRDVAQLAQLTGVLSKGEMAEAQRRLNVELADSLPLAGKFVDTFTDGMLNKFDGTLSSMWGMLKQWFANAIAMAAKNRIIVGMGVSGGGVAGAAGVPGIGGAGGVLGGAMSGLGALGGGILSGASGFLSAAMGGLGSAATYTGFMLKGATAGLAGLGSAIGAIALPVAAVAAVFSFFKKRTKELDAGIRVTVKGMDTLVEEFRKTETKRFWGLSKKTRTSYDEADRETSDAISRVVGTLQAGVMEAAKVLGFGSATFRNFAHEMKVSTKGMSEEEALKAVQDAIAGLGDDFAGMVPGLNRMRKDGEGASDALLRLSQSLVAVNGIMDTLGHRFRAAGLSGADAASKIADAFGGLDAMAQATQRFYEAFYSDAERLATTTRQTAKAMAELGIAMPRTRNEYRAIIGALDLTTEKGRKTYAAMIGMADAFDLILPQIGSFTKEMEKLQGKVTTALDGVIDKLGNAVKWNASAAADWRKAGTSIREYLDKLRGTASALFTPLQARAANQALYQRTLQQAMGGNVEAAQSLPGAAQSYLGSVQDTARSRVEAALAQARVAAALGKVAVKTDTTATALEKVAELQQKQLDLLVAAREHIAAGNALTKEGITRLLGQLGGLDERIKLRAGDAGTIVAGFNDSLKATKVAANLTGAEGLQSAMGTLRGALLDLRAAIAAETKRQQDAVKKANEVVNKPPVAPKPTTPAAPAPVKPKAYTLADYKLVGGYGLGGSEGNGYAYQVRGPLGGVRTFNDSTGNTGWQEWIKRGNFPAFATGGTHRGGPAYIGEKDLELVAPSRIYSPRETKAMLDNREVVAELQSMRSEMSDMSAHIRRTADSTRQTEKELKRLNAMGLKIDSDDAAPGFVSDGGTPYNFVATYQQAQQ